MRVKDGIIIACFFISSGLFYAGTVSLGQNPKPSSDNSAEVAGISANDAANELPVFAGKSVLIDFERPVIRVAIGQSDIAETTATSPTEIMVNGKVPGETTLIVWERGGGRQFFNVKVRSNIHAASDQLDALRHELSTDLPDQNVKISYENGTVFLRGTVKDLTSADRALKIAATAGKVVNLLYVDVPPAEKQVLLKVRFASFDRSKGRDLGLNVYSTGLGNTIGTISTGQYAPPTVSTDVSTGKTTATLSDPLNISTFFPGLNIGATIKALEQKGVVQILAEPNVLASNGKQASFLAGGEYPYPVAQGSASGGTTITIMFKEYGVRLGFIPTITPRGTIHLQVAPEVSSLDLTNAVTISGFTVPAISTRKVKTEVELNDDQSFVIGGLLDNRENETFKKLPFIGDVPILGKLFQSDAKSWANTELIVIVTPEIVDPIPAGSPLPQLKYPEKFLPANSGIPMHQPDMKTAGATPEPLPPSIPVEKLVESMRPGKTLVDSNAQPAAVLGTGNGYSSYQNENGANSGSAGTSATPVPTAPKQ